MSLRAADRPNVLFIMADQMKGTSSSLYWEHGCDTPSLERLSRTGILFDAAFTPHPLCVPARVSLWSSRYSRSHGSCRNQTLMRPGLDHAFRVWKEAGFHVGLIGKNHCFADESDLRLFDTWCEISHLGLPEPAITRGMEWFRPIRGISEAHSARRQRTFAHPMLSWSVTDHPLEDYSTGLIAGQTVRFLEKHRSDPFCLWVSFPDPHSPYEAPARYVERYPAESILLPPWDPVLFQKAPERVQTLFKMMGVANRDLSLLKKNVAVYYGMIRFLDDAVGRIMDALEGLDLTRKTIVVFCSDHGDFMGEHRMTEKGGALYDCLVKVPLVVSAPGMAPEGERVGELVSLLDVVPTLFNLQGLPVPGGMQGQVLPPLSESAPRDAIFAEYGAGGPPFGPEDLARADRPWGVRTLLQSLQWREAAGRLSMVRTRDWKMVLDPAGGSELYDLHADPWELDNLIDDPGCRDVTRDLRRRLSQWQARTGKPVPVPLPEPRLVDDWPAEWTFL